MIAVALMMVQQLQTMSPPTDEQQAAQQKMMKFMTIFFGIMFYKVAAGLCMYFIASSLWGCAERMLLPKKKKPPTDVVTGTGPTPPVPVPPNAKWKNKQAKIEKKEEPGIAGKAVAWWKEVLRQAEKK
jgi:YidC/Oxa1 family membrane protein insertase